MQKSKPKKKSKKTEPNAPWGLKVFILFHVVAITCWSLPKAAPAVLRGEVDARIPDRILAFNDRFMKTSIIQPYLLSTGLWQSWDMFSPNPANEDVWEDATVQLRSGAKVHYQYPRMYLLPPVVKYEKERYRKFFEHANTDEGLWPYFAQRVAYVAAPDPSDPAVKVTLTRHWYDVPRPVTFFNYLAGLWKAKNEGHLDAKAWLPDNPPKPTKYESFDYYVYSVQTGTSVKQ